MMIASHHTRSPILVNCRLGMFSSEQAVMQASREDLQTIEGIGEKTSNRIRWAISDKDGTLRR